MNPYYFIEHPPPIYSWNTYSSPVDSLGYERTTYPSSIGLPNPVCASAQQHHSVQEGVPSEDYHPALDYSEEYPSAVSWDINASQMFPSVNERLEKPESGYESSSDPPSPIESSVLPPVVEERILTIPGGPCLWEMSGRVCMKWCQNPEEMTAHLNEVHIPRENNVMCYWSNCGQKGKPFKKRYAIVNHVRVHTGETPFQCDVCRKGFARAANLKVHERTHTGNKPFLCPVEGCSKRCSNSSDRIRHIRSHLEGSPYECKKCDKRYTDPSSLRTHIRKHHEKGSSDTFGSGESLTDSSSVESGYHNLIIDQSYSQVEHTGFYDNRDQNEDYPHNYYGTHPSSIDLPNPFYASAHQQVHQSVQEGIPYEYYHPTLSSNQSGINALPTDPSVCESYCSSSSSSSSSEPLYPSVPPPVNRIPTTSGVQCLWETTHKKICSTWHQSPDGLAAHINSFHIPTQESVVCHWKGCGREGKPCKQCDKKYGHLDALKKHIKNKHKGEATGTTGSGTLLTDTSNVRQNPVLGEQSSSNTPSYSQVDYSGFYTHRDQIYIYPQNNYEY
ncbi:unnamed protein product [Caenorhabditis brenneri]